MSYGRWYTADEDALIRVGASLGELAAMPEFSDRTLESLRGRRDRILRQDEASSTSRKLARGIREAERQVSGAHPKRDLIREWPALAVSPKPRLENPIRLPASDVVALFDIHAPYQDSDFMTRVLDLAAAADIRTCVLGGDVCDIEFFSKFSHEPSGTWEQELEAAENILRRLAAQFERVVYFMGNHEARLFRTLDAQLRAERYLRLLTSADNVEITPFEWLVMDGRLGDYPWVFGHPQNASVIAARVPSIIASRRWTEHHVVLGHGHLWGMVQSDDGRRYCIDAGMMADPDRLAYQKLKINNRPAMHQGALVIRAGIPWLLHPRSDMSEMARWWRYERTLDA